MSSVRVPNRSTPCGSPIRRALHAAAKSAPRRKSRFPCMMCKEGPAREHSASAPTTDALNGSPESSSPAQYSNRSPRIESDSAPRAAPRRNSKKTRLISGRDALRCRSEMKKTAKGPLDDFCPLDDHVLHGHVGVTAAFSGLDTLYVVDHVLAFDYLAEHAVAPTLGVRGRVVEETVVLDVDEELARCRMRFGSPRHGDRIALVLDAVVGFVLDGTPDRFLSHSRLESAALDHETVDDAVKHGVGVEARFDVVEKILDRFGCASGIELERDDAEVGLKLDHGAPLFGWFQRDRFDRDGPLRNVLVLLDRRGRRLGNSQHSVHPLDHAPKHRVPESPRGRLAVIEKTVVLDVDEEFRGCRMPILRARHRNRSQFVLQARLEGESGLVFYWSTGRLLAHSGLEAAPLDHETVDDAVKYRAVVETAVDVLNEIRDRLGSLVGIELERETAHAGLEFHARILRPCAGHCQQEDDQRRNAMHVDAPGRWIPFGRRRNEQTRFRRFPRRRCASVRLRAASIGASSPYSTDYSTDTPGRSSPAPIRPCRDLGTC